MTIDISLPRMFRKPVVLAGGTASGKSNVLELLDAHSIIGTRIIPVPEVFTDLVRRGIIKPTLEPEGLRSNIALTAVTQVETERELARAADPNQILVCDRGLMDVAAFLPGGVVEAEALIGRPLEDVMNRYGLVVYLGLPPEEVFLAELAKNPARRRSYAQVCEIERKARVVYSRHPNYVYVPYEESWDAKAQVAICAIRDYILG